MGTQHSEVNQTQRRICSSAITAAIAIAVIFIIVGEKAVAKGLLLGTLFSIVNFILMGKSIQLTLGISRPRASMIGFTSIMFRYVLLAIPLVVAIKIDSFNLVAAVVGIFAVQIVTLVDYLIIRPIWEGR
ncbi:MAG TPA: ATP synthase subunit I [Acidobacteriota bacterium]|nr:ATP synthase subunit I [Acidobacteriota bacterium]